MRQSGPPSRHPNTVLMMRQAWKLLWAVLALSVLNAGPLAVHAKTKTVEPPAEAPVCNHPHKRVYVLAGPRRSATTSVADFFYQYARGPQPNRAHGKTYHPLAKFRWPLVYGSYSNNTEVDMPYKRFNHLVTDYDTNAPLATEILQAIKRDYDQDSVEAVIFGGEEYEQVGIHRQEGNDAIGAIRAVQALTGVPDACITVIFNYRPERFEHWVSLYGNIMQEPSHTDNYNKHMCDDESATDRLQELGTTMNPMYLAETYLEQGWNVKMIDMEGVDAAGTDISHTIACQVMGGVCDEDGKWVLNHQGEILLHKQLDYEFKHLSKEEEELSEQLFRYRDCAFEGDLRSNPRFEVLFDEEIWADCEHDDDHEWIYQSFRDPDEGTRLFFDALLSQVDCSEYGGVKSSFDESRSEALETTEIDEFLDGTYQKKHTFFHVMEDTIENKNFSIPLILVVVMFALGAGYFMGKVRDTSGYRLTDIEMSRGSNFSSRLGSGFGPTRSSSKKTNIRRGRRDTFADENDDSSSSSDDSDDSDNEFI